jgi:hypothetical protein
MYSPGIQQDAATEKYSISFRKSPIKSSTYMLLNVKSTCPSIENT